MEMVPSITQDMSLVQTIQLIRCSFYRNQGQIYGLIHVSQNSKLSITNSYFQENYSYGRGSIVYVERQNSKAII